MLINDILPLIMPEVAGCPSSIARIAILRAAQELCRQSKVWTAELAPIVLADGVRQYELAADLGQVDLVREVSLDGLPLTGAGPDRLNVVMPGWRELESKSPTHFNVDSTRAMLNVYPLPRDPSSSIIVTVSLVPLLTDLEIADEIFNHYGETIEMGAKAKLMLQRNTQWADAKIGEYYRQRFDADVASCRIDVEGGQVESTTRVTPRRFG